MPSPADGLIDFHVGNSEETSAARFRPGCAGASLRPFEEPVHGRAVCVAHSRHEPRTLAPARRHPRCGDPAFQSADRNGPSRNACERRVGSAEPASAARCCRIALVADFDGCYPRYNDCRIARRPIGKAMSTGGDHGQIRRKNHGEPGTPPLRIVAVGFDRHIGVGGRQRRSTIRVPSQLHNQRYDRDLFGRPVRRRRHRRRIGYLHHAETSTTYRPILRRRRTRQASVSSMTARSTSMSRPGPLRSRPAATAMASRLSRAPTATFSSRPTRTSRPPAAMRSCWTPKAEP